MKKKDPAAVKLGRKGGMAGRGSAKTRSKAHYLKMAKIRRAKKSKR